MEYVHYTQSVSSVEGILANGLLINPLERKLIRLFSDSEYFADREPQQFGMVSLRKEGALGSRRHIKTFGKFGIVFEESWVKRKEFYPVMYLKEGSKAHRELKEFFDDAVAELKECIDRRPTNDAFPFMAYTNKNVAGLLGAKKHVRFLEVYEHLEPHVNRWQREYRAVQRDPLYTTGTTRELVESIRRPGWNKMLMTLKFNPDDVSHFVTTFSLKVSLAMQIPEAYRTKLVKWKIFA